MIQVQQLSHVTHAVRDRQAAKELYQRILGAEPFYEGFLPVQQHPAALLLVRDLCVELADLTPQECDDAYVRRHGGIFRSMTMQVPDAAQAAEDLARHGVRITEQRPHHFVADPATTHGVPIEFTDAALPDDPRLRPGWEPPAREADPLQLQGLWSVTMLVDDVAAGDRFFQKVLGAQNVGERMGGEFAKKSKFYLLGASRVSIMVPKEDGSELIKVIETQGLGIHGVCLNTTDVHPVARFLRRQGLGLLGSPEVRLTIHPHGFLGARYLFMRRPDPDDPHFIWHQPLSAQGRKP